MKRYCLVIFILLFPVFQPVHAQVTGFLENFNDNILTNWEVPQTKGTFALMEKDSVLKITYNRTAGSWEWDNFNFTPPVIDVTNNPYIFLRVKSNISTELTFKPVYQNDNKDWLQIRLAGDNVWHTVTFELQNYSGSAMNRIYMYLDGGTTASKSGIVYFDDLAIGDSVSLSATPDYADLEKTIKAAQALHDSTEEGTAEGQYLIGSKTILQNAIFIAEDLLDSANLAKEKIDRAVWDLNDACVNYEKGVNAPDFGLIDKQATLKTRYLYANLSLYTQDNLIFGMHDATGYGVGWKGDDDRSDVKDVCGDFPALYSWDMNKITRKIELDRVIYRITSAFERGGINTLCWHQYDPLGRSFYAENVNNERIVATILPGGIYHENYKEKLWQIAKVMKGLRGSDGHSIPIIFRPYHEHDGSWFWWGVGHCTSEEYNALWRFTVTYLRDSLNVHNFIYALSPSRFNSKIDYLDPYPGDDMIDIIGMDFYFWVPIGPSQPDQYLKRLQIVSQLASEKNKLAALTEVGQEAIPTTDLFTKYILNPIKNDSLATFISYAAVWRNESTSHHFAPYPGHPSVADFLKFYNDPYTLFESDLPDMYGKPRADTSPPLIISQLPDNLIITDTLAVINIQTNERAFVRYSTIDAVYENMPFQFEVGQGGKDHSTPIPVQQGKRYTFYIRAADYYGNVMDSSAVISFSVDTLQKPVYWTDVQYEDKYWQEGKAPIGYGNAGTDSTETAQVQTIYFRQRFILSDSVSALGLLIKGHDGFVAYVNGREIGRVNMPGGEINYKTEANSANVVSKIIIFDSDALTALKIGDNVLAIEVHPAQKNSPTISFDARLFNLSGFFIDLGSVWKYDDVGDSPVEQTVGGIQSVVPLQQNRQPATFQLLQNYPNPFNPITTIKYFIPRREHIKLEIYDITGRLVQTLKNSIHRAGGYEVVFNAKHLSSGIYLIRLKAGNQSDFKRMVLLK